MKILNLETIVTPASNYAQGVVHTATAEPMVISGQLDLHPDGSLETGLESQIERAWSNLFAVMAAGGFDQRHLLRVDM